MVFLHKKQLIKLKIKDANVIYACGLHSKKCIHKSLQRQIIPKLSPIIYEDLTNLAQNI